MEPLSLARSFSSGAQGIVNSSISLPTGQRVAYSTITLGNNIQVQVNDEEEDDEELEEDVDVVPQASHVSMDLATPKCASPAVTSNTVDVENIRGKIDDILEKVKSVHTAKEEFENQRQSVFTNLMDEFMARGEELFKKMKSESEPVYENIATIQKPIKSLVENKYVEIYADLLPNRNGPFGRYNNFGGSVNSNPRKQFVDFNTFLQDFMNEKRNEGYKKQQAVEEEARRVAKAKRDQEVIEKRTDLALNSLMPMLPQLSLEQCIRALLMNKDDVEKTMQWVFDQPEETLWTRLSEEPAAVASASIHGFPKSLKIERNNSSQQGPARLILKVSCFDENTGIVQLRTVLDRNRVPVDIEQGMVHSIPIADIFQKCEVRFLSEFEVQLVENDLINRIPTITYQMLNEDEFCPIGVTPNLKLGDYKMDFSNGQLVSLVHRIDGSVKFKGILDEGFGLVDNQSPIEVYTQAINAESLNIVHLHIHDVNDTITFDRINLTGTDKRVEDLLKSSEFKRDASGKVLTYRVVVKDDSVIAVLYLKGNSVERALFIEHKVPAVGSLVNLADNRLGIIKLIPTGLVVSVNEVGVERIDSIAEKVDSCLRKHPEEMSGYVDVELLIENGVKLFPSKLISIPICKLKLASESDQLVSHSANALWESAQLAEFQKTVEKLEVVVNSPIIVEDGKLNVSMVAVEELKTKMLSFQSIPNVGTQIDPNRIKRILGSMRAFAVEYRNAASKINT